MATPDLSRRLFDAAVKHRFVRSPLFRAYDWAKRRNSPFLPLERDLGIDTRGVLPNHALRSGKAQDSAVLGYQSTMPSVVRGALRELGDVSDAHFIDIGAGKGCALAVATEFNFASISGIEINPDLCAIARRNAAIVAGKHPDRTPIRVIEADASQPYLPHSGIAVAFAHHPFGEELIRRLLDVLSGGGGVPVYFVYVNPVHGDVADAHPGFTRWFAGQIGADPEERSISGQADDSVVIWRAGEDAARPACASADRAIQIVAPGEKAALA